MAYPTVSAPYGFKPVNLQGGRVFSGSTRMIPIPTGYTNNLFNGDLVGLSNGSLAVTAYGPASGTTPVSAAAAGAGVGIFVGCEYTNTSSAGAAQGPIYGKNRYQYWQGGTYASDAIGYVVDDPLAYFRVAVLQQPQAGVSNAPGTTIGYMSQSFLGTNAYVITNSILGGTNSGNTATGDSAMGVTGTAPAAGANAGNGRNTSTLPFRIIQLVPDTAVTVTTTNGSTALSSGTTSSLTVSSATGIQPGMQIWFSGSAVAGARQGDFSTVTGVSGTTVTFTAPRGTGSGSTIDFSGTNFAAGGTVYFIGYPEVIVGWNFGYQSYNLAAGV